jgi:tetratricopeptide (TPR) repeat protein
MKTCKTNGIPLEAQYLYRRGMEMAEHHKDDLALNCFRQAVFIAPGFSKAYLELGKCLEKSGQNEKAAMYFLKASRIDPFITEGPLAGIINRHPDAEMQSPLKTHQQSTCES